MDWCFQRSSYLLNSIAASLDSDRPHGSVGWYVPKAGQASHDARKSTVSHPSLNAESAFTQIHSSMQSCVHALTKCISPVVSQTPASIARKAPRRLFTGRNRSYASVSAGELRFGQPVHETHPHLLKAGERKLVTFEICKCLADSPRLAVTRGITALEYAQRRSKLAAKLPKNSFALLAASEVKYRSGAVFYEFHQDSNFFYLTGKAVVVVGMHMLKN